MKDSRYTHRLHCSIAILLALLAVLVSAFYPYGSASAHTASVSKGLQSSLLGPHFLYQNAVKAHSTSPPLPCLSSPAPPRCYSPQQIRRAYGIQSLLDAGITGKGRTIVIVDAFQSPTIKSDLQLFDLIFGMPDPTLNIIAPFGLTPFNPNDPQDISFAGEISLDVEWAHAVAPGATIDLVLANPADSTFQSIISALVATTRYAIDHELGDVISQSFGLAESCFSPALIQEDHQAFREARAKHMTVLASAGDSGSAATICNSAGIPVAIGQGVLYPESDPLVSSVGGTTLDAAVTTGKYISETAWTQSSVGRLATGGGFSSIFARPPYQNGIPGIGAARGVPDIAYNADPLTGVETVVSSIIPGATLILPAGGTSAGSPQWAGLVALFDQSAGERLGFLNPDFYRISASPAYSRAFHDITTGNNAFSFQEPNGTIVTIPGFDAGPGWDPTTGVGSPKAGGLAALLLKYIDPSDGSGL